MKIHQIIINDSKKIPKNLPTYSQMCINSLNNFYGDEDYHLYCGEEIEEIIKSNFDKDIFDSYCKLKPYAFKADLAKYCLLYLYGGLYIDLNVLMINSLNEDFLQKWDFFAFRDIIGSSFRYWSISNSIIFSKQKTKVIQRVIDMLLKNTKEEYYGVQPIDVSGPTLLGRAVSHAEDNEINCLNGELLCLNSQMTFANKKVLGFFIDNGDFIALKKPPEICAGDIQSMGFEGTNNYVEMWRNEDIYEN